MLIKTSELSGTALDWAVGDVLVADGEMTRDAMVTGLPYLSGRHVFGAGRETNLILKDGTKYIEHGCGGPWRPSTDWAQGGPLWDKWATSMDHYDGWLVAVVGGDATGATKLIALCRAIVAAKLGDEVEVPDELLSAPL